MTTEIEKELTRQDSAAKGMEIRETNSGMVTFINTEYVTPKLINIMCAFMNKIKNPGHGINSVMFRIDGHPKSDDPDTIYTWMYFPDTQSIVCNLKACVDLALFEAIYGNIEEAAAFNVFTSTWQNILQNFFHEIHHGKSFLTDRDLLENDEDAKIAEEKMASTFAKEQIIIAAKTWDIEPEFSKILYDMIDERLHEEIIQIGQDDEASEINKEWMETSIYQTEKNIAYYVDAKHNEDGEPTIYQTYKEFLHSTTMDAADDPDWNSPSESVEVKLVQKIDTTVAANYEADTVIDVDADDLFPDFAEEPVYDDDYTTATGMEGVVNTYIQPQAVQPQVGNPIQPVQVVQPQPIQVAQPQAAQTNIEYAPSLTPEQLAAANNVITPTMGEGMYEPFDLGAMHQAVINGLYNKIYKHIFQTCGYNGAMNPFFSAANNIVTPVPISREEALIAKHMETEVGGQYKASVEVTTYISGFFINKARTLPGFSLCTNRGDGTRIRRKFVPQNPQNKRKDGQFTSTALEAQAGAQILWIIDPDEVDKQFAKRIYNGELQSNINGSWGPAV